jgi:ABC-type branched-subunit amino acid transport system ATPase component
MTTATLLETRAVSRRFGSFTAVDQVTFGIRQGEAVGVIGPNPMHRPDAIDVLVRNQIAALLAHGVAPAAAAEEAEVRVHQVMEDLNQLGLADVYVRVALRRAQVYRLRSQGVLLDAIAAKLGFHKNQISRDYIEEMLRKRNAQQ